MARTPFPALLQKFARAFGPPLLVVATAGLLGALKAPPQPPVPDHPGPESTSEVRTVCAEPLNLVRRPYDQTFKGIYRARYYGLKMRIPDGLIGFDGGASHHGFHIPLDVQEGETPDQIWERHSNHQPPPFIGLYFQHNASMTSFEEVSNEHNWGSAKILNRRKIRIAGMNGDRTRFSEPDGETGETLVIDQIMLGRRWLDGEWRDEHGQPVPDTFYFFYLRTTEKRYKEDVKVFENILKTWRTFDE